MSNDNANSTTYEYGEVLRVEFTAMVIAPPDDGRIIVTIGETRVLLPLADVTFRRRFPADGEPSPGEMWTDRIGTSYFAVAPQAGSIQQIPRLVDPTGVGTEWTYIHASAVGPIRRVQSALTTATEARDYMPELGEVAA